MAKGKGPKWEEPKTAVCPSCGGSRTKVVERATNDGKKRTENVPCDGCGGSGKVFL